MCMIVDTNVIGELFKGSTHPAGYAVFKHLSDRKIKLIIGGSKQRSELHSVIGRERQWFQEMKASNVIREINNAKVDSQAESLLRKELCRSDDEHIIALARLSGARLLYSKDRDLHQDFKNKRLIDDPRGKIYSTLTSTNFTRDHRDLLQDRDLCRRPKGV